MTRESSITMLIKYTEWVGTLGVQADYRVMNHLDDLVRFANQRIEYHATRQRIEWHAKKPLNLGGSSKPSHYATVLP